LPGAPRFVRSDGNVEGAHTVPLGKEVPAALGALGAALTESHVPPDLAKTQHEQGKADEGEDGREDVVLEPAHKALHPSWICFDQSFRVVQIL